MQYMILHKRPHAQLKNCDSGPSWKSVKMNEKIVLGDL